VNDVEEGKNSKSKSYSTVNNFKLGEHMSGLYYPFNYIISSIEKYQEQPTLIDSHVEKISRNIIEFCRNYFLLIFDSFKSKHSSSSISSSSSNLNSLLINSLSSVNKTIPVLILNLLKVIYVLCKVRGSDVVSIFIFLIYTSLLFIYLFYT
jgi:hypothetical protein